MSLYGKGSCSPWGQGSQGSAVHERPAPAFLGAPGTHGKARAPGLSSGLVLKGSVKRGVVYVSVMPLLALGRERVPRAGGAGCALGRPRAPPGGGHSQLVLLQVQCCRKRGLEAVSPSTEWGSLMWVHTRPRVKDNYPRFLTCQKGS